ncbi:MAG: hypothetical protein ACOYJG_06365 [Prevotella sp.]
MDTLISILEFNIAALLISFILPIIEFKITKSKPIYWKIIFTIGLFLFLVYSVGKSFSISHIITILITMVIIGWPAIIGALLTDYYFIKRLEKLEREKKVKEEAERELAIKNAYLSDREDRVRKYGQPSRTISFASNDIGADVDIFESQNIIILGNRLFHFKDILRYEVLKDKEIEHGRQYIYGSYSGVGVGNVYSNNITHKGPFGTRYGNSRSSYSGQHRGNFSGVILSENDHLVENLCLCLTTNDINSPTFFFYVGSDKIQVKELCDILDIIKMRNQLEEKSEKI